MKEGKKRVRQRGRNGSTWQPVTKQIHFKASLRKKAGSVSECCGETGLSEVTRKT